MDHRAGIDAAWAASGAMALTGHAAGPPLLAPRSLTSRLAALDLPGGADPLALLGERAALAGFARNGTTSCGGATRLLAASDGWIAVALPRPDDLAAVPAWLSCEAIDPLTPARVWPAVERIVASRPARDLVERAGLLGLAAAALGETAPDPVAPQPAAVRVRGDVAPIALDGAVVADLSALWAGPLCGQLLQEAGARVIKVESIHRPDGARSGPTGFFDLLHAGQQSIALDFTAPAGRAALHRLVGAAAIVITSCRARAFGPLGLDPWNSTGRAGGPKVWVAVTGHGLGGANAHRVAFGDDGAVAGGLVAYDGDQPVFCADAVADPATGMLAALAAIDACGNDGRWVIDAALARVAAGLAHPAGSSPIAPMDPAPTRSVAAPRARPARGGARPFGADTEAVRREFAL